ncbi:GNAT family protein [Corynebacterium sp. P3-F1]|uniref:GNAT family N-acetyltransferase n=1 Tax=Corynebacterium sp. P3-F1 TaxID=3059080 RepID=UPI00265D4867|nr:GNAT family protein [Corynebacterium sp. P3-F1]WKK61391.1 GNAT family protein [Corynebacterium sp. P3-F1]
MSSRDEDFSDNPTLSNQWVTLEPLSLDHAESLAFHVGDLSELWYQDHIPTPAGVPEYIESNLADQRRGERAPWAIVDPEGNAIGVTTFLHPDPANRSIEIGSTWITKDAQGTPFNKAAKLLMLQRAFEDLGCLRVEIRTHYMNRQSRAAIESLGAKLDGVLRRHKILKSGLVRDTCVYSILDTEWPEVKTALEARLKP